MEMKMHFTLLLFSILLQFGFIGWRLWETMPRAEFFGLVNLLIVKLSFWLDWLSFLNFNFPIYNPAQDSWIQVPFDLLPYRSDILALTNEQANVAIDRLVRTWLFTFPALLLWPLAWAYFSIRSRTQRKSQHLRGVREMEAKQLVSATKRKGRLPFGKAKLPQANEVLHTLVVGAIGMGKTVLLSGILDRLIELKEPTIIHDFKGDFTSRHYNPDKDILFNPCDGRGVSWNLFDEIDQTGVDVAKLDVENICTVLIPEPTGSTDPIWTMAPRDVLRGILLGLIEKGRTRNEDIYKVISSPNAELKAFLESTELGKAGAAYIESTSKSLFTQSVLSILRAHTAFFQYMDDKGEGFSIERWLQTRDGNIYLLNSPQTK